MPRCPAIKPYGVQNQHDIHREFRFKGYIQGAEHRGISLSQLKRVIEWCEIECRCWREQLPHGVTVPAPSKGVFNFHHIMKWLVGPATLPTPKGGFAKGCAFVELLADERQTPVWFVSHVWNGSASAFLKCMQAHYLTRDIGIFFEDSPYWVCTFATRQHLSDDNQEPQFKGGPEKASFYQAIHLSKGLLLVLGEDDTTSPFMRTWCLLEVSLAVDRAQQAGSLMLLDAAIYHDSKAEIVTTGMTEREGELEEQKPGAGCWAKECREKAFPLEFLCKGLSCELEQTEVSPQDTHAEPDGTEGFDDGGGGGSAHPVLKGVVVAAVAEEAAPVVEEVEEVVVLEDYRSEILNYVAGVRDKHGDLTDDLAPVGHNSYALLARKVRTEVALVAWRRALLQAPGVVEDLCLPAPLRADTKRDVLIVDYFGCLEMNDAEVATFAKGMPPSLSKLELSFLRCCHIGDRGAKAVCSALPSGILILQLDFSSCGLIGDKTLRALAGNLPPSLESLRLRFRDVEGQITNDGVEALSRVLPTSLRTLELDFAKCEKVGQKGIEALSERLTACTLLSTLHLDFWMCGSLNDEARIPGDLGGVQMLAKFLPETLETLQLRFTGICGDFSDKGVEFIAKYLPRDLKVLKLDLLYLDRLGDAGLDALGHHLPTTLHTFELKVNGCDKITDAGVLYICDQMPPDLQTLLLHFEFCGQITSKGVMDLAERLPQKLRSLSLNFGSCRYIKDDGLIGLANFLPTTLTKLHIDLKYCKKIGDLGVAALGKWLPKTLVELSIQFGDCELIYDAGIVALAQGMPQSIEWMEINLWRCQNVGDIGVMYLAKFFPPCCKVLLLTLDGTKVSAEKKAICTGVESMRRCRPTANDLVEPLQQPDRTHHYDSRIAWLRRHGPNLDGVDAALHASDPVMASVRGSLLAKLGTSITGNAMSKSHSLPSLVGSQRKKPPMASPASSKKRLANI